MARAGFTVREIGEVAGCSHTQVVRVLAKDGPLEVGPVSINARSEGEVVVKTDSPQIIGAAIKRALERAGIEVRA